MRLIAIFSLVLLVVSAVVIPVGQANETVSGAVYGELTQVNANQTGQQLEPGQNQPGSNSLAEQQGQGSQQQNQQSDQANQEQPEPGQPQSGSGFQAGNQQPDQAQGSQQAGNQPTQQPGSQQVDHQVDQSPGGQQVSQQSGQGENQTQISSQQGQTQLDQPQVLQSDLADQQTNQQSDQGQPGQQQDQANQQTDQQEGNGGGSGQQSVNESVYSDQQEQHAIQQPGQQSVAETVYSSQQQQAQQPVQPRPEVPAPPVVRAESPPPFSFRGQGNLQVSVMVDAPVEMVLNAVEGVPKTVAIEIFYAGAKVAEVRDGQIVFAAPFTVSGSGGQLEIRLSGHGRMENAKIRFREKTPAVTGVSAVQSAVGNPDSGAPLGDNHQE